MINYSKFWHQKCQGCSLCMKGLNIKSFQSSFFLLHFSKSKAFFKTGLLKHQTLFMLEIRQMVWIYLTTKMHLKLNFSFQMPLFKCTKKVQVSLCQKLFFLQNMGRTCCVQKLFWMPEIISVHNMLSPGLSLEFSCIKLVIQWTICCHIVG